MDILTLEKLKFSKAEIAKTKSLRKWHFFLKNKNVAEINELERLKNRPDEAQMQMTRLSETKSAAEEARKNAADKLAVAETELAEVEKQSRDADKKLGLEREERVRCEAVVEQVALYQSELAERIKEKLQCLPEEILDKAGLDINDTGPEIDETEARIERLARERTYRSC